MIYFLPPGVKIPPATAAILETRKLILGSSSVYRRELLQRLRIPFDVCSPDIDETALPEESASMTACRLAEAKARAVAAMHPGSLVIGSDQVAILEGTRLGKPLTHENAVRQLHLMSGKEVVFHTALSLFDSRNRDIRTRDVPTLVRFRTLDHRQIERYLLADQPYQCAGSARLESLGIALIRQISGDDPTALIGLPLIALTEMLEQAGISVL